MTAVITKEYLTENIKEIERVEFESGMKARIFYNTSREQLGFFQGKATRHGVILDNYYIGRIKKVIMKKHKDPQDLWDSKVKTIVERLEASGLWEEILNDYKLTLKLGRDKVKAICKEHDEQPWENIYGSGLSDDQIAQNKATNQILLLKFLTKYPEVAVRNSLGELMYRSAIKDTLETPVLKSMYFGKYYNQTAKANIKKALAEKEPIRVSNTVKYDVSFNYQPNDKKAWYSEEYRNCGNGHYYLALDHNTALFYEND